LHTYVEIKMLFESHNVFDFIRLPDDEAAKQMFAKHFRELTKCLEAAKIQGFKWDDVEDNAIEVDGIKMSILSENEYLTLALRYKELSGNGNGNGVNGDVAYDIDGYLTEIDTGLIDTNYMNSNFVKYLKALDSGNENEKRKTLDELHSSFAT